jgi:hypothetical protein
MTMYYAGAPIGQCVRCDCLLLPLLLPATAPAHPLPNCICTAEGDSQGKSRREGFGLSIEERGLITTRGVCKPSSCVVACLYPAAARIVPLEALFAQTESFAARACAIR